jgi:hypothetical protein
MEATEMGRYSLSIWHLEKKRVTVARKVYWSP